MPHDTDDNDDDNNMPYMHACMQTNKQHVLQHRQTNKSLDYAERCTCQLSRIFKEGYTTTSVGI
eukprot:1093668-Amphidinium_carterae.1